MGLALPGFYGFTGGYRDPNNPGRENLEAWWTLDEASGTRVDSHGANNLTDNFTVTQAAGKVGNAAQFAVANTEYLDIVDNVSLSMGDIDFTICAWAYLDSKPGAGGRGVLAKYNAGAGEREYLIQYRLDTNRIQFLWGTNGGATGNSIPADNFGVVSTGAWMFIVAGHNGNNVFISVNNGAKNTAGDNGTLHDSTSNFHLGSQNGTSETWDGRIDETCLYKRVLSSAEITWLWNSGDGRTYADL